MGAAVVRITEAAPAPQLRHRAMVFGLIAVWVAMSQYDSLSPHDVPDLIIRSEGISLILVAASCLVCGLAADYLSPLLLWTYLPLLHVVSLLTIAATTKSVLLIPAQFVAQHLWIFREICLVRFVVAYFEPLEYFLAYGIAEMFRCFGEGQALSSLDYSGSIGWHAYLAGRTFSRLIWLGPWLLWTWDQRSPAIRVLATDAPGWRRFLGSKALWLCLAAVSALIYFRLISDQWEFKPAAFGTLVREVLSPNAPFFGAVVALIACWWLKSSLGRLSLDGAVRRVLITATLIGAGGMLGYRYWSVAAPAHHILSLLALAVFNSVETGLLLIAAGRTYAGIATGVSLFLPPLIFHWVPHGSTFPENPKDWETATACAALVLAACLLSMAAKNLTKA